MLQEVEGVGVALAALAAPDEAVVAAAEAWNGKEWFELRKP